MGKTSELKGQTAEEFIEERHALEATIRLCGNIYVSEHEEMREVASKCRQLAIGLISSAFIYTGELTKEVRLGSLCLSL